MEDRTILHVDMNSFFASVELLNHSEATNRPMAVCGDATKRHGIILAKNELAKAQGVKTAEAIWQAQRKCPELLLLPPHHALYREYSAKANQIYERFTDRVEPASIDESYLDVTGTLHLYGSGLTIADQIRYAIKKELHLTVSVGVSFCKFFAKMGSDYRKPDATTVISRTNYQELLYPLPIANMLYVGKATAEKLNHLGVHTIGELALLGSDTLQRYLGRQGMLLYQNVHGLDTAPVLRPEEQEEIKSIGNGETFSHDLTTLDEVRAGLLKLCTSVGTRLRKHAFKYESIQVSIKTPELKTIDRQQKLPYPTNITQEIFESALHIVTQHWNIGAQHPIRLLTVTAIRLVAEDAEQLSLYTDPKQEALDQIRDHINAKYGKDMIKPARFLKQDKP